VVIHDSSVDRTTNGTGLVAELTLAQIKRLKLKANDDGANAAITKYQIPTLSQALTTAKGKFYLTLCQNSRA
jgi:glycerophosphoryl diester phosphodiesterase